MTGSELARKAVAVLFWLQAAVLFVFAVVILDRSNGITASELFGMPGLSAMSILAGMIFWDGEL